MFSRRVQVTKEYIKEMYDVWISNNFNQKLLLGFQNV